MSWSNTKEFYKKHVDIHPFISTVHTGEMRVDDYRTIAELQDLGVISIEISDLTDGSKAYKINKIKDLT